MRKAVRRVLLMSALLSPSALYALGLGEIRLNSALNQPFDAEIELVSAAQEDLSALRASLASSDTFQRYGLERPAYLSEFTFRVVRADGRDVLRVTSPRPITEPFVTLLVEASWPRGRLLREYTVLLDPPVFAPAEAAASTQVETPKVARAPAPAPAATRAEPAAPAPAPAATRTEPAVPAPDAAGTASVAPRRLATIEPGSTYRVRPNDTLWQIASAAYPGTRAEVNRAMLAIFQANPAAFGGNINLLRAGSELNMPSSGEVTTISASAAAAEVARQYRVWSEGGVQAADAASDAGRLRLVTPDQGTAAPSTATTAPAGGAAGSSEQLQQRVQQLEAELAEARRLLEVRNAELATLQGAAPAEEPGVAVEAPPVAEAPVAEAPVAEAPVEEAAAPAAEPEAAAPEQPQPEAAPAAAPEAPAPSLLDTLLQYWWALLALLAAVLGITLLVRSRRQAGAVEESLEEVLAAPARDLRARPAKKEPAIVVEERKPAEPAVAAAAAAVAPKVPTPPQFEETISGEAPVSVESGDPVAEADFHMAYGLYDQAAELVQMAAKREPQRRDLKLKLAEIFFVWGNRERFLEQARKMGAERVNAPPGEWDKVVIMGKQLAPDDPLFATAAPAASVDSLDIDLQPSDVAVDLELPGAGEPTGVDLDVTLREPRVEGLEGALDFSLDEPVRGAADASTLAPTVESPYLRSAGADEPTAEVPVEELGIDVDLGSLDELEDMLAKSGDGAGDTVERPLVGEVDLGAETELLSNTSIMQGDELREMAEKEGLAEATGELPTVEMSQLGGTSIIEKADLGSATSRLPEVEAPPTGSTSILKKLDFALDSEAATMSEVGTKLDLARAYIDMGDPEGARSILDEVLKEGSAKQKREAERLMAGLP